MIFNINENELFNISSKIGESAYLPKYSENIIGRYGMKMISEDGTSFLQGFGAFDIINNNNINCNIIKIWIAPECLNTNFEEILKFHLNEYAKEIINNIKDDEKMNKRQAKKNEKKNNNKIKFEKPKIFTSDKISKSTCIHLDNNDHIINKNKIITVFSKKEEIDSIIDSFSKEDKLAETPNLNKNNIGVKCFIINNNSTDNCYPIGFALIDIFETSKGKFARLLNIYIKKESRNFTYGTNLLNEIINWFNNESEILNLFVTCVGENKKILSKICKKLNLIFDGESRGRINYYL